MYIIELNGDCAYDKWMDRLQAVASIARSSLENALSALENCGNIPDVEDDRIVIWKYEYGIPAEPVWEFRGWHFSNEHGLEQGHLLGHDESWYDELMEDY